MRAFLRDVRFGVRTLRQNPGFTAAAVLVLALGIATNMAIFTLVNAVLLQALPIAGSARVVTLWEDAGFTAFSRNPPAPANYADWKAQNQVFADMAAMQGRSYNLAGAGEPEQLVGAAVTASFFAVLGVQPAAGRGFTADEDRPGGPRVAVIGHRLWRRRFAADPRIAGAEILLNGEKYTVVGIMPPRFAFPSSKVELWTPIAFSAEDLGRRGSHSLRVVARLKPGVPLERASRDMDTIARRLQWQYPGTNAKSRCVVVPVREQLAGRMATAVTVLAVVAGCVLLIVCAKLANLLLSRAVGRRKQIAVRRAPDAGAGLALARLSFPFLATLIPAALQPTVHMGLDARAPGFTAFLAAATAALFGAAPALEAARPNVNETL